MKITFQFTKQPGKPQVTEVLATFINLSSDDYTDFLFQAAVPKVTCGVMIGLHGIYSLNIFWSTVYPDSLASS